MIRKNALSLAVAASLVLSVALPAHADPNGDLASAAYAGNVQMLNDALLAGANVNWVDSTGQTALIWAAQKNNVEALSILMRRGANANLVDTNGYTALMWAAQLGHTDAVRALVQWGADPGFKNVAGRTAYDIARAFNKAAAAEALSTPRLAQGVTSQLAAGGASTGLPYPSSRYFKITGMTNNRIFVTGANQVTKMIKVPDTADPARTALASVFPGGGVFLVAPWYWGLGAALTTMACLGVRSALSAAGSPGPIAAGLAGAGLGLWIGTGVWATNRAYEINEEREDLWSLWYPNVPEKEVDRILSKQWNNGI